jgi:hypothetical protein
MRHVDQPNSPPIAQLPDSIRKELLTELKEIVDIYEYVHAHAPNPTSPLTLEPTHTLSCEHIALCVYACELTCVCVCACMCRPVDTSMEDVSLYRAPLDNIPSDINEDAIRYAVLSVTCVQDRGLSMHVRSSLHVSFLLW